MGTPAAKGHRGAEEPEPEQQRRADADDDDVIPETLAPRLKTAQSLI